MLTHPLPAAVSTKTSKSVFSIVIPGTSIGSSHLKSFVLPCERIATLLFSADAVHWRKRVSTLLRDPAASIVSSISSSLTHLKCGRFYIFLTVNSPRKIALWKTSNYHFLNFAFVSCLGINFTDFSSIHKMCRLLRVHTAKNIQYCALPAPLAPAVTSFINGKSTPARICRFPFPIYISFPFWNSI